MITLLSSRRVLAACLLAGTLALSVAGVASAHASLARANIKASTSWVHVFEALYER
jgi:hypothetical protein